MNQVYISNKMEHLAEKLASKISSSGPDIFQPTLVITQNGGMNAWLTAKMAETNGIFAHFRFQNQDGFLNEVYELLFHKNPTNNHDVIKYKVYDLLLEKEFATEFPGVASYYQSNDLRRIQLAARITDLFDQYQLYRTAMIQSWDAGQPFDGLKDKKEAEKWQMWLWNRLGVESKEKICQDIFDSLERDPSPLKEKFTDVHLFGISIFTSFHKSFYEKLGQYINVHYYLQLPTLKEPYTNTLLESYGTKARELQTLFAGMKAEAEDFEPFNAPGLLGNLQNSILNNHDIAINTGNSGDASLQVSSHFTPLREVEALYNYLLDLFEQDKEKKELQPSDILVITPDINTYEPFIKAVFRNAPVKLPIKVSGAATTAGDSITASLELIMNMTEEDYTAEKVLGLLEQNRIRKAFNIENIAFLRAMINKAGIRFGRENRTEDDTHYVSWNYGLQKIVLGYAMLTDSEFEDVYPLKDAEASASYDLLRLRAFTDALENLFDARQQSRTLEEWKLFFFEEILGFMVWSDDFNKDDRTERNTIYKSLGFTTKLDDNEKEKKVPFDLFLYELKQRLFNESRSQELFTGRITFTSGIPVRGLPYKVVGFIGLNNGVFPRQDQSMGFDLMGNDYQPGDRSKKEADKSLFLDTFLAAREKLYLSYIGQNVKDNSELPPSIVLDTLTDYLGLKAEKHPLHGFSSRYDDQKLFTYLYNTPSDGSIFKTKEKGKETQQTEEIRVNDFIKFFEAPIDWYFKKVLGIIYDGDDDDTLPETELFELDHLQKWEVKNELLRLEGDDAMDAYIRQGAMKAKLPLKNLGRKVVEDTWEEISPLRERFLQLTANKEEISVSVDIELNGFRIKGIVKNIFDGEYIFVSTSKSTKKYLVRAYLTTLLLHASNASKNNRYLGLRNGKLYEKEYPPMDKNTALEKLKELLKYLQLGIGQPLIFTLKSTDTTRNQPEITLDSVIKALQEESAPGNHSDSSANLYIKRLMDEGYFDNVTENDVNQVKTLAGLLNL